MEIVLLVVVASLAFVGCVTAVRNPRKLWQARIGSQFKQQLEPSDQALRGIRNFGFAGLIIIPLMTCMMGYWIYDSAKREREFDQQIKETEQRMKDTAPGKENWVR
jgi:hypothetical protein